MDKERLLREAKSLPVSEIVLLITDVIASLESRALAAEAQLAAVADIPLDELVLIVNAYRREQMEKDDG